VEADSEEEVFLGTVTSDKETAWIVNIRLQGKEVLFKLDTGAEVTVISEEVYHTLKRAKLENPSKVLYGPAQQRLEVVGQFAGSLKHGEHSYTGNIFVVRQLRKTYWDYQQSPHSNSFRGSMLHTKYQQIYWSNSQKSSLDLEPLEGTILSN